MAGHEISFDHVDVLQDENVREGMKQFWPTFPQLWVDGLFIGGGDHIRELCEEGGGSRLQDVINSSVFREKLAMQRTFEREAVVALAEVEKAS